MALYPSGHQRSIVGLESTSSRIILQNATFVITVSRYQPKKAIKLSVVDSSSNSLHHNVEHNIVGDKMLKSPNKKITSRFHF